MDAEFQFLGVSDNLSAFLDHCPILLGFSPEIGATIHAWNVENGNAFKEDVAQVHSNPVTLRGGAERKGHLLVYSVHSNVRLCVCVYVCVVGSLMKDVTGPQPPASVRS